MDKEVLIGKTLISMYEIVSCDYCGARLRFGDLECPHCGADVESEMRRWAARLVEKLAL